MKSNNQACRRDWRVRAERKGGAEPVGEDKGGKGTDLLGWLSGTFKSNKAVRSAAKGPRNHLSCAT